MGRFLLPKFNRRVLKPEGVDVWNRSLLDLKNEKGFIMVGESILSRNHQSRFLSALAMINFSIGENSTALSPDTSISLRARQSAESG